MRITKDQAVDMLYDVRNNINTESRLNQAMLKVMKYEKLVSEAKTSLNNALAQRSNTNRVLLFGEAELSNRVVYRAEVLERVKRFYKGALLNLDNALARKLSTSKSYLSEAV